VERRVCAAVSGRGIAGHRKLLLAVRPLNLAIFGSMGGAFSTAVSPWSDPDGVYSGKTWTSPPGETPSTP